MNLPVNNVSAPVFLVYEWDMELISLYQKATADVKKNHPLYLTNDMIRVQYLHLTEHIVNIKTTRAKLLDLVKAAMSIDYDAILSQAPNTVFRTYEQKHYVTNLARVLSSIADNKIKTASSQPKSDIPVLSEERAKVIMTKAIRLASKNIVKCFIPKRMVESIIMEELFGQNLVSKPLEQYSKEDFAVGKAAASQILQVGLTPYKSGFLIKPVCMAGAYKNSLIKYQARNLTYYILNTKDKTVLNTRTGEVVPATFKNCSYLNDARLINIVTV